MFNNSVCIIEIIEQAKESGDLAELKQLIESGKFDINTLGEDTSVLGMLAQAGWLELVQIALNYGADVNLYLEDDPDFWTPLMAAVDGENLEIVKLLVKAGAEVDFVQEAGDYALAIAARLGNQEIFNYIAPLTSSKLRKKAKAELKESLSESAKSQSLDKATRRLFDIVIDSSMKYSPEERQKIQIDLQSAIVEGANVNTFNELDQTPLMYARGSNLISLLLNAGADPNLYIQGFPPLAVFARGDIESLKLLLQAGADVNARIIAGNSSPSFYGQTALMVAAGDLPLSEEDRKNLTEIVRTLIAAGADINLRDDYGNTALMLASRMRRNAADNEIIKTLKQSGASEAGLDEVALSDAIFDGDLEQLRSLIASGVNINSASSQALYSAAGRGHIEIVKELIEAGAFLDLPNYFGTSPLIEAIDRRRVEIAEILINAGANVQAKDAQGDSVKEHVKYSTMTKVERKKLLKLIEERM